VQALIRPIAPGSDEEIAWVASRMRATLVELLGEQRGGGMYSTEWLRERVRFHLDPAQCEGGVFVAVVAEGLAGHTIVRRETWEDGSTFGLFSTFWVEPGHRRSGLASRLVASGERWMRERGLTVFRTWTDPGNAPLIALMGGLGYAIEGERGEFVVLRKEA